MRYFLPAVLIILLLPSCIVSKKKYDDLARRKFESDQKAAKLDSQLKKKTAEIAALNDKIASIKSEFNTMQYELRESNAVKNSVIDSLSTQVTVLSSDKKNLNRELEEAVDEYKYEKRRLDALNRELDQKRLELSDLKKAEEERRREAARAEEEAEAQKSE